MSKIKINRNYFLIFKGKHKVTQSSVTMHRKHRTTEVFLCLSFRRMERRKCFPIFIFNFLPSVESRPTANVEAMLRATGKSSREWLKEPKCNGEHQVGKEATDTSPQERMIASVNSSIGYRQSLAAVTII